jgi:hypothetical protein
MKSKSEGTNEYTNFTNALSKVLKVSHSEMKAKLEAEKREKPSPSRKTK